MMVLRIATWNLCLGLLNKKDIVLDKLNNNKIDVCCLQETELDPDVPLTILRNSQYVFESELNTVKMRVGLFINKHIDYIRRNDLEEENKHLVIIDIVQNVPLRIINPSN